MIAARLRTGLVADGWLLLAACVLAPAGLLSLRAIALADAQHPVTPDVARHAAYILVGVVAMTAAARLDYHWLRALAPQLFGVALVLLVLVLALGSHEYGARRWIGLGGFTIQPSEFAKIATIAACARFAAERPPAARAAAVSLAMVGVATALILVEPDLGTATLLVVVWAAIATTWGVSWRFIGALVALGASMFPLALAVAVPAYQRERIAVFLDPGRDPFGSGFTLRQVEVALSGGGVTGRGFGGSASAFDGLGPRASDFAFAQVGEFGGAAAAMVLLVLFALVAWRGYLAAARAPDAFGRLLASGLTTMIVAQAAIHIAVNLRLFPATGIPLPFISTGGSALVVTFLAVGILQSVAAQAPAMQRDPWRAGR
ncbi:MAG: hypothetical protein EXR64_02040 [Dehalococcoidia bacterium]|nr:hypothetical protein [Dehalococcoidia bacterium]